jgi:hypothetical protein
VIALRIGDFQRAGLEIYVLDPAHDEDGPLPFCVDLDRRLLVLDKSQRSATFDRLTEAANSADDGGDTKIRDALAALARRVLEP